MKTIVVFIFILVLLGCKREAVRAITEETSIRVAVTLAEYGINSERKLGNDNLWSVYVDRKDLDRSLSVISAFEFIKTQPIAREGSFAALFGEDQSQDPVVRRTEEELSRTLSMMDGVIAARVHINSEREVGTSALKRNISRPLSASILLITAPQSVISEIAIKEFSSRSIGISIDKISLIVNPVRIPPEGVLLYDPIQRWAIGAPLSLYQLQAEHILAIVTISFLIAGIFLRLRGGRR